MATGEELLTGARASGLAECGRRESFRLAEVPKNEVKDGEQPFGLPDGVTWKQAMDSWGERGDALEWRTLNRCYGLWVNRPGEKPMDPIYWVDGPQGTPNLALGRDKDKQLVVPWGPDQSWRAHPDYISHRHRRIIECYSSTSPETLPIRKARQVAFSALYGGFHDIGYESYVYITNAALWEHIVEFWIDPEGHRAYLQEQVEKVIATFNVYDADDPVDEILPERQCRHSNDSPASFCQFSDWCFRNQPVAELDTDPRIIDALIDIKHGTTKEKDKAKEILRPYLTPGERAEVTGPDGCSYTVMMNESWQTKINWKKLEAAGLVDKLSEDVKRYVESAKRSTWTVRITEPQTEE